MGFSGGAACNTFQIIKHGLRKVKLNHIDLCLPAPKKPGFGYLGYYNGVLSTRTPQFIMHYEISVV